MPAQGFLPARTSHLRLQIYRFQFYLPNFLQSFCVLFIFQTKEHKDIKTQMEIIGSQKSQKYTEEGLMGLIIGSQIPQKYTDKGEVKEDKRQYLAQPR